MLGKEPLLLDLIRNTCCINTEISNTQVDDAAVVMNVY
jgi:hypothetical protein